MKIVFISDTHTRHKEISVPEGDVLICSGDFTNVGSENDVRKFNKWIGTLPHEHKLVISGNHDFFFERVGRNWINQVCTNFTYLQDEEYIIDGIKFYGSPWTPVFGNWAFTLQRNSDNMKAVWDMIPEDTDVLITHGPPYGILDKCPESQGSVCLAKRVFQVKPKIHCFGHIHEGYGTVIEKGIQFVNAACLDGNYNVSNQPIVLEI